MAYTYKKRKRSYLTHQIGSKGVGVENAHEEWLKIRFQEQSFDSWLQEQRTGLTSGATEDAIAAMAELLTPMFFFLAAGNKKPKCGHPMGTLHQRAWILLYTFRPDLVHGQTIEEAAVRFGTNHSRLAILRREFLDLYPSLNLRRLGRNTDKMHERRKQLNAA